MNVINIATLEELLNSNYEFDDADKDPDYGETEKESNDSSSNEGNEDNADPMKGEQIRGRKRKRGMNQQCKCQEARNKGFTYIQKRGKGKESKRCEPGADCNYRKRCFQLFNEGERIDIFQKFWNMGNYDLPNAYLHGCIQVTETKRKTKKNDSPSRRSTTVQYCMMPSSGKRKEICKTAVLNIHGLPKSRGRLEYLTSKIKEGCKTPSGDGRGKHHHHPKKYSTAEIEFVNTFINRLPTYTSHYKRVDSPNRKHMSMEYTIESCYDKYKEEYEEVQKSPVSRDKFRRIFVGEHNIYFKNPKSDTCSKCDCLNIQIGKAKRRKTTTSDQLELHQRKAKAGQDAIIKLATKESEEDDGIYVITFDLQQALPTPKLSTGPAFYKKKLFCYNLSIQSCTTSTGEKFKIRNVVKMEFLVHKPEKMKECNTYYGEMDTVSLRRRGRPVQFLEGFKYSLPILRRGPRPIEASKLNDVLSCFPYIPEVHHAYYKTLKVAEKPLANNESSESEI